MNLPTALNDLLAAYDLQDSSPPYYTDSNPFSNIFYNNERLSKPLHINPITNISFSGNHAHTEQTTNNLILRKVPVDVSSNIYRRLIINGSQVSHAGSFYRAPINKVSQPRFVFPSNIVTPVLTGNDGASCRTPNRTSGVLGSGNLNCQLGHDFYPTRQLVPPPTVHFHYDTAPSNVSRKRPHDHITPQRSHRPPSTDKGDLDLHRRHLFSLLKSTRLSILSSSTPHPIFSITHSHAPDITIKQSISLPTINPLPVSTSDVHLKCQDKKNETRLGMTYDAVTYPKLLEKLKPRMITPEPAGGGKKSFECSSCGWRYHFKSGLDFHLSMPLFGISLLCKVPACAKLGEEKLFFSNHCSLIRHLRDHDTFNASSIFDNIIRVTVSIQDPVLQNIKRWSKSAMRPLGEELKEFLTYFRNSAPEDDDDNGEDNTPDIRAGAIEAIELIISEECENPSPFSTKCHECGLYFEENGLLVHLSGKLDENDGVKITTFTCKICTLSLGSKCALASHVRLHNFRPPHVCPECGISFGSVDKGDGSSLFEQHLYTGPCYHGSKRTSFFCPICPGIGDQKSIWYGLEEVFDHMMSSHSNLFLFRPVMSPSPINQTRYVCCYCRFGPGQAPGLDDTFGDKKSFLIHLASPDTCPRSYPFRRFVYRCTLCVDHYQTRDKLEDHVGQAHLKSSDGSSHTSLSRFRRFRCNDCPLYFSDAYLISCHIACCHDGRNISKGTLPNSPSTPLISFSTKIISESDAALLTVADPDSLVPPIKRRKFKRGRKRMIRDYFPTKVPTSGRKLDFQKKYVRPKTIAVHKKAINIPVRGTLKRKNGVECGICYNIYTKRLNLVLHAARHLTTTVPSTSGGDTLGVSFCLSCDNKPFPSEAEYTLHLKEQHGGKLKCIHCTESFDTPSNYVKHVKKVQNYREYLCQFCQQPFTKQHFLNRHVDIYHKKRRWLSYRCWVCQERCFNKISKLLIHVNTSHKIPRSQVDMRLVNANRYSNFTSPAIASTLPNESTPRVSQTLIGIDHGHQNIASSDQGSIINHHHPWQCQYCSYSFQTRPSLCTHLVVRHGKRDDPVSPPTDSTSTTGTNSSNNLSPPNSDPNQAPSPNDHILCSVCGIIFETALELKKHGRSHGMAFLAANQREIINRD